MAVGFIDQLSPSTAQRLVDAGARRRYPAGTYLFHENDDPNGVFLIEEGMVRIDRTLASGRTLLLTLATAGDLVGELAVVDDRPRSATAATVHDSRVLVVTAAAFEDVLASSSDLALLLLRRVSARLRALSDQLIEAAAFSAPARVAARLVELLPDGVSSEGPFEMRLPITQEELAQWAGLSREGAVKGLGELRSAGVLETGRRRVTVLDVAELRRTAEKG